MKWSIWRLAALSLLACAVAIVAEGGQVKKPGAPLRKYQVPAGSILVAQLRTPVSSASSQIDDQVDATLAEPVTQDGVELVPAGSILHGTIEDVVPASDKIARGSVTMTFAVVQHAETGSRAAIRTRSIKFEAEEPIKGSDSGRRSKRQLNDVVLAAGHPLRLTLSDPLIVFIPTPARRAPRTIVPKHS